MSRRDAASLKVDGLVVGYGRKQVVRNVSFTVDAGEVLLVLGHNGAGKTTLVNGLFGLLCPTSGRILYDGRDVAGRPPAANVLDGIAYVPQGHGIFRSLSVRDNLELGALAMSDKVEITENLKAIYTLFPILKERSGQIGGTLSGGQQQMLAIGMALMHRPRLLLLDEPSIGLAPNLVLRVMESVREVNREFGTSILIVEQNVEHSLPIADRVMVIKTGQKIYDGPPAPLADRVELLKLF